MCVCVYCVGECVSVWVCVAVCGCVFMRVWLYICKCMCVCVYCVCECVCEGVLYACVGMCILWLGLLIFFNDYTGNKAIYHTCNIRTNPLNIATA